MRGGSKRSWARTSPTCGRGSRPGPRRCEEEAVRQRMAALGQSVWQRIDRARRALAVPGNVRGMTPYFVGRNRELADLHRLVGVGKIGLVTAVHGLGGQGKTELAVAYARGYADWYSLGLWSLGAEGHSGAAAADRQARLRAAVRLHPHRRREERRGSTRPRRAARARPPRRRRPVEPCDQQPPPRCSSSTTSPSRACSPPRMLSKLPRADWLRMIATTRLDPRALDPARKQLGTVAVDSLDPDNALRLIVDHLPTGRLRRPRRTRPTPARSSASSAASRWPSNRSPSSSA